MMMTKRMPAPDDIGPGDPVANFANKVTESLAFMARMSAALRMPAQNVERLGPGLTLIHPLTADMSMRGNQDLPFALKGI